MDNCGLDKVFLSVHLDGELDPGDVEKVEKHLAEHPECNAEFAALKALDGKLKSLPEEKLPQNFELRYGRRSETDTSFLQIFNRAAAVIFIGLATYVIYDKFVRDIQLPGPVRVVHDAPKTGQKPPPRAGLDRMGRVASVEDLSKSEIVKQPLDVTPNTERFDQFARERGLDADLKKPELAEAAVAETKDDPTKTSGKSDAALEEALALKDAAEKKTDMTIAELETGRAKGQAGFFEAGETKTTDAEALLRRNKELRDSLDDSDTQRGGGGNVGKPAPGGYTIAERAAAKAKTDAPSGPTAARKADANEKAGTPAPDELFRAADGKETASAAKPDAPQEPSRKAVVAESEKLKPVADGDIPTEAGKSREKNATAGEDPEREEARPDKTGEPDDKQLPPGAMKGYITVYISDNKTAMIDIGKRDGVKLGQVFWVYRNGKCIGSLEVDKVWTKSSFAQTQISLGQPFEKGDLVVDKKLEETE